ncbi:MAG: DEAD/DEAH box helicase, partial [Candidatus Portiera sp.]|nr:DEAD/DEAH box helicase [Portiera sp.]
YEEIRKEFYDKTKNSAYKKYLQADYNSNGELQVHEGYFSGDKGSTKEAKEASGIDTILNDKEGLLSFAKPLRFVFSVWALQEGWDNPNIFTICKLASTSKETSRRQQIGRGLRIAVNQKGRRLTYKYMQENEDSFYDINALDMVVSSQEQGFIYQIQNEILDNSFSVVGDRLTLEILKDKGLSDNESSFIYYKLSESNIIDDDGNIMTSVADFIRANRELFDKITDERYKEILQLFRNNSNKAIENANAPPKMVEVRREQWQEFKNLWEVINKQRGIVYANIQQAKLINTIAKRFNKLDIKPHLTRVTTEGLKTRDIGDGLSVQDKETSIVREADTTYNLPNTAEYYTKQPIEKFIQELANAEKLPLSFLCPLFSKLEIKYFKNNPAKSREELIAIIQSEIHDTILHHVAYQFSETTILANSLQEKDGKRKENLRSSDLGRFYWDKDKPSDNFLYDTVVYDSAIEKDAILKDPLGLDDNEITVFAKLPKINIPTPYKNYSPDFAYLIKTKEKKELFLVVETKGYAREDDIPDEQQKKISYAQKFFKDLEEQMKKHNPNFVIRFKSRVNKEDLSEIITDAFTAAERGMPA